MKLKDFQYNLPEELIAQSPTENRTDSRLLVIDRAAGKIVHTRFEALADWLAPGDCLVFNNTKVLPARLLGVRLPGAGGGFADSAGATGGAGGSFVDSAGASPGAAINAEALLLRPLGGADWEAMVKPGRRLRAGARVDFGGGGELIAEVISTTSDGERVLRFNKTGKALMDAIRKFGKTPLPPYIKNDKVDADRYQTVYATREGSAAAPTAGLHFTREYIELLRRKGVGEAFLTLHVGPGTFQPVKTESIEDHRMHAEWYELGKDAVDAIEGASGRLVAVGTTSVRAVESAIESAIKSAANAAAAADRASRVKLAPREGWTDIFIYPGYEFRRVDALLTNFHLPGSTLIMLVCAFAGYDLAMEAYRAAVAEKYRFFSFGDAMFVV